MPPHSRLRPAMQTVVLAGSIVLLAAAMTVAYDSFATAANAEVLAMGFVLEAFMALGMTAVIVSGGIDLSVGAVLPFSAIVTALMLRAGIPIPLAITMALAAAAVVGALNAGLMIILRVHPFIVTLATMLSLKGLNLVITRGAPIAGLPAGFAAIGQGRVFGIPAPLAAFAVVAVTLGVLMRHQRFWRQTYLIGGNARAARTAGVPVRRVVLVVYATTALLAGVAGVIAASIYGSASAGFGQNSELRVITAVVIGGASLNGGTGTIGGTMLGMLFLALLYNAFAMTGISTYWQDVVTGGMVLVSVLGTDVITRSRATAG
jgi:ribose transport system permease protein